MPNFIAQNATVVGKVSLGEDSSIWYSAVIRADVEEIIVGKRTNIQDGAIVHGAIVGDGTLIGMRSTILNRAKIGKHCIIGACALVTEGMEIPDYSMVLGVPAKVVKQLPTEYAEKLLKSAAHYVVMAKRHQSGEFKAIQ